jgi:hypothetical protein
VQLVGMELGGVKHHDRPILLHQGPAGGDID